MGKLDWQSPQFLLLDDLSEDWEPLPYAVVRVGSREEAFRWVSALVRAGLMELVKEEVPLSSAEQSGLLASPEAMFDREDVLMQLSPMCDAALEQHDMQVIARALAGHWHRA